jgi:uncharacterized protein YhdP
MSMLSRHSSVVAEEVRVPASWHELSFTSSLTCRQTRSLSGQLDGDRHGGIRLSIEQNRPGQGAPKGEAMH